MKNLKRALSICMVVAMLGAVLVLASCSLFSSAVESMAEDLVHADSYTYETDRYILMVDVENLVGYRKSIPADKDDEVVEYYYYYDEEKNKYYSATVVDGDEITKYEIEESDFVMFVGEYAVAGTEIYAYTKLIDKGMFTETEDGFEWVQVSEYDEDSKFIISLYVNDDDQLCVEEKEVDDGETEKEVEKFYNINDTEIEIPEDVLKADAKKK